MKLRVAAAALEGVAGIALTAGALMAGPASAAESAPPAIHPRIATFTGLSLSTAQVTLGAEQSEKATFTVSNLSGPHIPREHGPG
jgi:hypothetical protein